MSSTTAQWPGAAEVVALPLTHTKPAQKREHRMRLDAFGDDSRTDPLAERDERARERARDRVGLDLAREAQIELDDVGRELQDVTEAREAGADIVDRNTRTAPRNRSMLSLSGA